MTTSGQGQNSHNIRYLSQGDTFCLCLSIKLKDKIVTISDICHKVVVTISDIYCNATLKLRTLTISLSNSGTVGGFGPHAPSDMSAATTANKAGKMTRDFILMSIQCSMNVD